MKKLVIVESPAKAHTVGRILGPDYTVMASVGHIRDLPENKLGIRISDDARRFDPEYVIPEDKADRVAQIVKAASGADEIYLASDPDREGESIAWHLNEVLRDRLGAAYAKKTVRRVEYHEITAGAIKAAFAAPHDINTAMVDAQQARRLLDRFVGWKVSPRLKKADIRAAAGGSLSAGRVQSVALRIICEREAEIRAFKPVTYWNFAVELAKKDAASTRFPARLKEFRGRKADGSESEIRDEAAAAEVSGFLSSAAYSVADVSTSSEASKPYPPFKTSTMQQAASNALHYSPETTMRLAQALYEAGLITYIRSDAPTVSKFAQDAAREFVRATWGVEYSAPCGYVTKKEKGQQQAHECIRPTDVNVRPGDAKITVRDAEQAARLYDLIWKQFVKSQMKPAVYDRLTVSISATGGDGGSARLSAGTRTLAFPGFLMADPAKLRAAKNGNGDKDEDDGDDDSVASMPALSAGEALDCGGVNPERKETKPPARYNEASIVRKLEESGIGRPSTYAAVVKTLKDRRYVTSASRVLRPTDVGEKVVDYLVKIDARCAARENGFPGLFYVEYTSRMEAELDKVADDVGHRDVDWQSMLADFYANLGKWLDATNFSADPAAVRAVLAKFNEVKEWRPARKVRSRAYDDKRFVQDIAFEVQGVSGKEARALRDAPYSFDPAKASAGAAVTERQLVYLVRVLSEYEAQIPGLRDFVLSLADSYRAGDSDPGAAETRDRIREPFSGNASPACDAQKRIFDAMPNGACEGDAAFFRSLSAQVASGKSLSPKQMFYLGRMFVAAGHEGLVPGFSRELCSELGVEWTEKPAQVDPERAGELIAALSSVETWDARSGGGKGRRFDDREFFASVSSQFGVKRRISEKQLAALERMLLRYKDQILGAGELIARYGIAEKPRRRASGGKKSPKA